MAFCDDEGFRAGHVRRCLYRTWPRVWGTVSARLMGTLVVLVIGAVLQQSPGLRTL